MPSKTKIQALFGSGKPTAPTEHDLDICFKSINLRMNARTLSLPAEILIQVAEYVNHSTCRGSGSGAPNQRGLWAMTMVSRSWYAAAVPELYRSPEISGKNFKMFVRTLCPSINPHIRKTDFSDMVKVLDMSYLVHDGSKSLTSRILGRVRDGLEAFVAPQASFATSINCLASLSKCVHLRKLDLSFIAHTVGITQLLRSISKLTQLEWASLKCDDGEAALEPADFVWPPNLKKLEISGSLSNDTLRRFRSLPASVVDLKFSYCTKINRRTLLGLLGEFDDQLESLTIGRHNNYVPCGLLADWLQALPKLCRLQITMGRQDSSDLVVACNSDYPIARFPNSLQHLELDFYDVQLYRDELDYDELWWAISEGYLDRLRRLILRPRSSTRPPKSVRERVQDLDDLLKALAREDGENATITEDEAGAYIYRGLG
ncbi:MAG: hypothetical protein Q9218_003282 [Villophora microphyllina]